MMKQAPDINLESDEYCFTIGKLKEILYRFGPEEANLPVFVERIHDHYFDNNGWTTLKVKGDYPEQNDEFIKSWDAIKNENGLLIYCHY
jgi:hypothetical protein